MLRYTEILLIIIVTIQHISGKKSVLTAKTPRAPRKKLKYSFVSI